MKVRIPESVEPLTLEPEFDASKHLQLEEPEKRYSLKDFGYSQVAEEKAPFDLAVTSPFRLLSDEGVSALNEVIRALTDQKRSSERMASFIRGTIYRSKFIRDFCSNADANALIEKLAGGPTLPHPMGLYQGHINLKPEDQREVDRWHTDTVWLDYVMMCTEPKNFTGGHFEFFKTTKKEAIRALIKEEREPDIVKVEFPKAGYAILQQGHLVVHRANRVESGAERTTFVQSYVPKTAAKSDVSKLDDCKLVDPPEILYTEWARYKAFLTQQKLEEFIHRVDYTKDTNQICHQLRTALRDTEQALFELSEPSEGRLTHFGADPLTGLLPDEF